MFRAKYRVGYNVASGQKEKEELKSRKYHQNCCANHGKTNENNVTKSNKHITDTNNCNGIKPNTLK